MIFKVVLSVTVLAAVCHSLPAIVKRSPDIPQPPMPPGMPAPPMSPPGMIVAAYEMQRAKRQAETTPPSRFARQAPETTPPSRFERQAPETTPPSRVARSVLYESPEMPKTIAQEAFYSKVTTINGDK